MPVAARPVAMPVSTTALQASDCSQFTRPVAVMAETTTCATAFLIDSYAFDTWLTTKPTASTTPVTMLTAPSKTSPMSKPEEPGLNQKWYPTGIVSPGPNSVNFANWYPNGSFAKPAGKLVKMGEGVGG